MWTLRDSSQSFTPMYGGIASTETSTWASRCLRSHWGWVMIHTVMSAHMWAFSIQTWLYAQTLRDKYRPLPSWPTSSPVSPVLVNVLLRERPDETTRTWWRLRSQTIKMFGNLLAPSQSVKQTNRRSGLSEGTEAPISLRFSPKQICNPGALLSIWSWNRRVTIQMESIVKHRVWENWLLFGWKSLFRRKRNISVWGQHSPGVANA